MTWRFNRVEFSGHCKVFDFLKFCSKSHSFIFTLPLKNCIVSQNIIWLTPSTPFTLTWSDIQRKVISTRTVSTPAFRSAHQRWPTANQCLLGSTMRRGNIKRSALGELL
jgi:hypothetical protein